MYLRDEWGAIIYEWADEEEEIPDTDPDAVKAWREACVKATGEAAESGKKLTVDEMPKMPVKIETLRVQRPKLNPAYDPSRPYQPRGERKEWAAVGMMGKLRIRDDGTCLPGGFCRPNDSGVATASEQGYRVLDRLDANKVLACIKG